MGLAKNGGGWNLAHKGHQFGIPPTSRMFMTPFLDKANHLHPFLAATAAQEAHLCLRSFIRPFVPKLCFQRYFDDFVTLQPYNFAKLQLCNIAILQHYNIATLQN